MGLATRFTLLLGLCTGVLATVACWLLLSGAADLQKEGIEKARRVMAAETAELRSLGAEAPDSFDAKAWSEGKTRIQEGVVTLETREGPRTTRIFRAIPSGGDASKAIVLFSPELEEGGADPLLILVLLVGGILVLSTIGVGAMMAIRLVAPLKTMAEDVLAISRGHLDRRIEGKGAVGELAHLAKAVDRMVGDLLEGQETEEALVAKEQEEDDLRSIRRNLQPMMVDPPEGFSLSTHLEEAVGAGTGDFVDAMADADGAPVLVVGASAADGLPGALLLAMTRAYLRSAILNGEGPAEACVTTNASLNRDLARGLFASAMVARLQGSRRSMGFRRPGTPSHSTQRYRPWIRRGAGLPQVLGKNHLHPQSRGCVIPVQPGSLLMRRGERRSLGRSWGLRPGQGRSGAGDGCDD